jgi:hypothetical protein
MNILLNAILTFVRIVCGILIGLVGCVALLNAPYRLANANFRFANEAPIICVSLLFGTALLWVAWTLIRVARSF